MTMLRALRRVATAPARRVLGSIVRVQTPEPLAALTFDDGPSPISLPPLLALLDRYEAKATFFVIGEKAARHPELIEAIVRAGHAVGNHTFSHVSLPTIPASERRREINACRAAIGPAGLPLLRPPFGHQTLGSRVDAMRCGHQVICWSVDAWDWLKKSPVWMADEIERRTGPGDIVLLHDAIEAKGDPELMEDRTDMLTALETVLQRTAGRLRFTTIPELLRAGRPERKNWVREKRFQKAPKP